MARLIVGLTGGIGSGKSAAADWFATQGIFIVDADIVAREVVAIGQPGLAQIVQHFGAQMLLANGELNRRALREHIFGEPTARLALEAITHPLIRQSITQQLAAADSRYALLVSPLLFESRQHEWVQRALLIDASEQLQIARATTRDTQSVEHIRQIMAVQMPRDEKRRQADDIVLNDDDLTHLYRQLVPLHEKYLQLARAYP